MQHHVVTSAGHIIGKAETEAEAIAVCKSEGFTPTGRVDFVPEDLAPDEFRYEPDGCGAFVVACDH